MSLNQDKNSDTALVDSPVQPQTDQKTAQQEAEPAVSPEKSPAASTGTGFSANKIVYLRGLGFALACWLVFWVFESFINAVFFYQNGFIENFLPGFTSHQLYIRLFVLAFFIVLSFVLTSSALYRSESTAKQDHLTKVLLSIRNVNQLICRSEDPDELCGRACELLIEHRGYYSSWIVRTDENGEYINSYQAQYGGDFNKFTELFRTGKMTECARRALSQENTVVIEEPADECPDCPMAEFYRGKAAFVTKLKHAGSMFGILTVSVPKEMAYDLQEQDLFEEVAGDIGLGLDNIERTRKQREYHQSLLKSRDLLEQMGETGNIGGWEYEVNNSGPLWTKQVYKIHEVDEDYDPPLEDALSFFPGRSGETLRQAFDEAIDKGTPYDLELEFVSAKGVRKWVRTICRAVCDEHGNVVRLEGTFQDITEKKNVEIALQQSNTQLQEEVVERECSESAMRESEEKFSKAFSSSPLMMCLTTFENGKIIEVNDVFTKTLGYRRGEIIVQTTLGIDLYAHPEDREKIKKLLEKQDSIRALELDIRHKSGRIINGEFYSEVLDISGTKCLLSVINDITERKRTQAALAESEERFRLIAQATREYIWDWDVPNSRVWRNQRFYDTFGNGRQDTSIEWWTKRIHPEQLDGIMRKVDKVLAGQDINWTNEYELRKDDGNYAYVIDRAFVVRDNEGKAVRVIGSIQDITYRRESEEKLRISEQIYRLISDLTSDYIYSGCLYPDGRPPMTEWIMGGIESISGHTPHHIKKMPRGRLNVVHPDDVHILTGLTDKVLKEDETVIEYRIRDKKDKIHWLRDYVRVVEKDPEGHWVRILGAVQDITDNKRAEEKLRRLNRSLNLKNLELQNYISITSHDLRSPLVNIRGFGGELSNVCARLREIISGVEMEPKDKKEVIELIGREVPEMLGFIRSGTEKMQTLLNGLSQISRIGRVKLNITELDVRGIVEDIVSSMNYQISSSGAEVIVNDLPHCCGDRDQLCQVFSNLISNALRYLSPDRTGRIIIDGYITEESTVYSVNDNGMGIAEEHREKIFEIFYRLDPSKTAGEGLGLSIVKRIMDRHNGEVWVDSQLGRGASFYISFPNSDIKINTTEAI